MNDSIEHMLARWADQILFAQHCHFQSSVIRLRRNNYLEIALICLTAAVGISIFVTLSQNPSTYLKMITGAVSFLAAIIAALHTSLRYLEKAEKHRAAAAKFGALGREIDRISCFPPDNEAQLEKIIKHLENQWNNITSESPIALPIEWEDRTGDAERVNLVDNTTI